MVSVVQLIYALMVFILSIYSPAEVDYQVIPDDAIRLRILAEDDEAESQALKLQVKNEVVTLIDEWVVEIDHIDTARQLIDDQLDDVKQVVEETLEKEGHDLPVSVEYDHDVAFPAKVYDYDVYPAGHYEAILITLGEGKGSNWWCVLFPPLCFVDFASDHTEVDETTDEDDDHEVEVSFFLLEWFK